MKARLIAAWVPGLFFLLGVLGILALHGMVKAHEKERIQLETHITAEQIRLRLEAWIDARVAVVQHLAGQSTFISQPPDRGAKPDALDLAAYTNRLPDNPCIAFGFNGGFQNAVSYKNYLPMT